MPISLQPSSNERAHVLRRMRQEVGAAFAASGVAATIAHVSLANSYGKQAALLTSDTAP